MGYSDGVVRKAIVYDDLVEHVEKKDDLVSDVPESMPGVRLPALGIEPRSFRVGRIELQPDDRREPVTTELKHVVRRGVDTSGRV